MRERNKELVENIGELGKEIIKQDLEQINGGDTESNFISNKHIVTVISATGVIPPYAKTKFKRCRGVYSLVYKCFDNSKLK